MKRSVWLGWVLGVFFLVATAFNYYHVFQLPPDAVQGEVQKIMYLHVPTILAAYLFLAIAFFCSLGYILKGRGKHSLDAAAQAAVEIGVLNLAISLITGALWGKPTWNTYWTWDARLTLTLVIFLLYSGYLIYRKIGRYSEKVRQGSALLAIFAFFSIPLNHMAVNWFRSIHQPSTIFAKKNAIDPEFMLPLQTSILLVGAFFLYIFWLRLRLEHKKQQSKL